MYWIGQEKIRASFNGCTKQTLPRTVMLIGQKGCGKHSLISQIAKDIGMDIIQLNSKTTEEELIDYRTSVVDTIYEIDIDDLLEKQQNQFLKFIEEPSSHSWVFVLANSELTVLPTIMNRCKKYRFETYAVNQLKSFREYKDEWLYRVCRTPGAVLESDEESLTAMKALCKTIVQKIDKATFQNALSISLKINYKEEYNKFDFMKFIDMLALSAADEYMNGSGRDMSLVVYSKAIEFRKKVVSKQFMTEAIMTSFLADLWKGCKANGHSGA